MALLKDTESFCKYMVYIPGQSDVDFLSEMSHFQLSGSFQVELLNDNCSATLSF